MKQTQNHAQQRAQNQTQNNAQNQQAGKPKMRQTNSDNILQAFFDRDYDLVLKIIDCAKSASPNDANAKHSTNAKSGANIERIENITRADMGDYFLDLVVAHSCIGLAKATNTKGQSNITAQAVEFAKHAQEKTREKAQEKSQTQAQIKTQDMTKSNYADDKRSISQYADFTLALAYAANGDIAEAKEVLSNLAKPFLANPFFANSFLDFDFANLESKNTHFANTTNATADTAGGGAIKALQNPIH